MINLKFRNLSSRFVKISFYEDFQNFIDEISCEICAVVSSKVISVRLKSHYSVLSKIVKFQHAVFIFSTVYDKFLYIVFESLRNKKMNLFDENDCHFNTRNE